MRIVFNTSFQEGLRAAERAATALAEAQRQVSTGRRMARPSDDPLGASTAVTEHASLSRVDAFSSASDAAGYRLAVADSALSDMVTQLTTAQTATLAARGSFQTQSQRDAARQQILAVRDALLANVNTKFQGEYLFSGAEVKTAAYTISGSTVSAYQGDHSISTIEVEAGRMVASTFDGEKILKGNDAQDILTELTNLAAAIANNDQAAIAAGADAVQRAFDRAIAAQTDIGNQLRTIDEGKLRLAGERTHVIARLSTIEDADLVEAATKLSQSDTAYRAALASVARIGQLSLMDYLK